MRPDGDWRPVDYVEPEITAEELAEFERESAAWDGSEEGQRYWAEAAAERAQMRADPNRLSNRLDLPDLSLLFARAVQAIYDETQEPCRLREATERAGMDMDEGVVACALAHTQRLIRHPVVDGMEGINLHEPVVG